jgi:hypothetical protein
MTPNSPALTTDQGDQTMTTRKTTSTTRSRFAKAAGILAVAAIAGMAAAGGAEAKSKHHGFKGHHGHKSHHGLHFKYYPSYAGYGHGYGRCFYRGWDGRIYKHRHCGKYGYRHDRYYRY